MRNKIIILITILLLFSCGTGPWFMNKNIYKTFKENIYTFPSDSINTNGYYIEVGKLPENVDFRSAIIFYKNGYSTNFSLSESELKNEIKTKITQNKDTILTDLEWWKIHNDSLIIEHYAEMTIQMVTWNYYQRGKVINDTLIELKFDDSPRHSIKYSFIATDSLPVVENKGRYLKKKWYKENLNNNRKTTANKVLW